MPENANFNTKYVAIDKVYTDSVVKKVYHSVSACTEDNPLAKARGLSTRAGGQTRVNYYQRLISLCYYVNPD